MIRLLVKIANWLDSRFPAKLVVTVADYSSLVAKVDHLEAELSIVRDSANEAKNGVEVAASRIGTVESRAAHTDAVRTLLQEVKKLQDEYASLKTSLGMTGVAKSPASLAFLNDEPVGGF
jgi:hypothetical protein